tara:strand:+ start:171 stop:338 length:168 start_codon:yes stop_codon:yes gene_type:complete
MKKIILSNKETKQALSLCDEIDNSCNTIQTNFDNMKIEFDEFNAYIQELLDKEVK